MKAVTNDDQRDGGVICDICHRKFTSARDMEQHRQDKHLATASGQSASGAKAKNHKLKKYYFIRAGKKKGPYTLEQISGLKKSGTIPSDFDLYNELLVKKGDIYVLYLTNREVTLQGGKIKCRECNREFKTVAAIRRHSAAKHGLEQISKKKKKRKGKSKERPWRYQNTVGDSSGWTTCLGCVGILLVLTLLVYGFLLIKDWQRWSWDDIKFAIFSTICLSLSIWIIFGMIDAKKNQ